MEQSKKDSNRLDVVEFVDSIKSGNFPLAPKVDVTKGSPIDNQLKTLPDDLSKCMDGKMSYMELRMIYG